MILWHHYSVTSAMETEEQLLPMHGPPWEENAYGVKFRPVRVPVTSPTRYVSYQAALNLRLPGEHTGDWHQETSFFTMEDNPHTLILAGPGGWGDSTPSLGSKGVRDMAHILSDWVIPPDCGPVWVANHYRAIADYVVLDTEGGRCLRSPRYCPVFSINQWLDTEEQIEHLVEEYLKPLGEQFTPPARAIHDEWLPTVVFS